MPPTRAASTTRGARSCQRIASWTLESGEWTSTNGMCDSADSAIPPMPIPTGPTPRPTSSEPTRNAPAQSRHWRGTPRARTRASVRARTESTAISPLRLPCDRCDGAGEVHEPRPPPRRNTVVDRDDAVTADRREPAPARSCRDRRGGLAAADRVREHDDVGVRGDDVLRGELRIPGMRRVGRVGDVPEAEEPVDAADERRRGRRVIGRVELVVDLEVPLPLRHAANERGQLVLHRAHELRRRGPVTGRTAELPDLVVRLRDVVGCRLEQHGDTELLERGDDAAVV